MLSKWSMLLKDNYLPYGYDGEYLQSSVSNENGEQDKRVKRNGFLNLLELLKYNL